MALRPAAVTKIEILDVFEATTDLDAVVQVPVAAASVADDEEIEEIEEIKIPPIIIEEPPKVVDESFEELKLEIVDVQEDELNDLDLKLDLVDNQ